MARIKGSVLAGRAPRKVLGSGRLNTARPLRMVCVRPVAAWQKGIGEFLRPQRNCDPDGEAAGSSGQGKKRRHGAG
uniref:PCNA-associated factor n=1 Tax=Phasianus colchicus TaxID=9054 RepID=A0A669P375_PHACC